MSTTDSVIEKVRELVGQIPCELCAIKGGSNIMSDGGCRHRPITDTEILVRLERTLKVKT